MYAQKEKIPAVLGMNIIRECYVNLFNEHGDELFQTPQMRAATPAWKQALRCCQKIEAVSNSSSVFKVRVQGKTPIRVAAGTMTMVPVTCPQVSGAVIVSFRTLGARGKCPSRRFAAVSLFGTCREGASVCTHSKCR